MNREILKNMAIILCLCCICSGVTSAMVIEPEPNDVNSPMPTIITNIYDSNALGSDYIYLTMNSDVNTIGNYLMILNDNGVPFFSKKVEDAYVNDFKVQPNGFMSYAQSSQQPLCNSGSQAVHKILRSVFDEPDNLQMKNGYIADSHDLKILPNGNSLLFGCYTKQIDLSGLVEGGDPNAIVSSAVVQELDSSQNTVFQWRTWDYYNPEDFNWVGCSDMPVVSKLLPNAISLNSDLNILLGTNEGVKKISRQTGDILWNLGGDENEFSFVGVDPNEAVEHFKGNDFHRLPNGNYVILYNGDASEEQPSKVLEYKLDDVNTIAELVWQYVPDVNMYVCDGGNVQRLSNGNTFICWGQNDDKSYPVCTEVTPGGEVVFDMYFDSNDVYTYRAYRMPFTPEVPTTEVFMYGLAAGNKTEFNDGTVDTGVSIKVNNISADVYNIAYVRRSPFAPLYPEFPGTIPCVIPIRIVISQEGIYNLVAQLAFDNANFNFEDPNSLTVYYRPYKDQGLFIPVDTYNNYVVGELRANIFAQPGPGEDIGEYIFCSPDLEHIANPPVLSEPADMGTVNQALPITFSWSPKGFVNRYYLQISKDQNFENLLVDNKNLKESIYTLEQVDPDTIYYWRVSTFNNAGQSDWTQSSFTTSSSD